MSVARRADLDHGEAQIVETPGVCGGYPRVGNTRIAVSLIVEAYRQTGESLEKTARAFPQLASDQIRSALEFYEGHRERVDADLARNIRAMEELELEQCPGAG